MKTLETTTTKAKAAKKAITRNSPKPPSKEPKGLTDDLERHSRDLGIPLHELRRICLRAGVDQLNDGELKVRSANRVMVSVDLSKGFSPEEIESIDRAAKRRKITRDEFLANAIQTGLKRHSAEMVRESEDKLPLMLPSWIVQRLADAGRVAELENPDTAIAEAVLGDLAKSPGGVKDTVTEAFFLRAPKATAKKLDKLIAGWTAQPGDDKGGEA
jgi:hypothetical protein